MTTLLKDYKIVQILPCLAGPDKIRVYAELSDDISLIFPYLNAKVTPRPIYNPNIPSITLKLGERIITLYNNSAWLMKINGTEDAYYTLNWLKALINDTFDKKDTITPIYERRASLSHLDVYKYLPGKNCGDCGSPTCLAFTFNLLNGVDTVMRCKLLFTPQYSERRQLLLKLLHDAGYPGVPSAFILK